MKVDEYFEKIKQVFVDILTKTYYDCSDEVETNFGSNNFEKLLLDSCRKNNIIAVNHILANGVNVNVEDNIGLTPIIIACKVNNTDMAKLLLDNGADVCVKSKRGESPILIACENNNKNLVHQLKPKIHLFHRWMHYQRQQFQQNLHNHF